MCRVFRVLYWVAARAPEPSSFEPCHARRHRAFLERLAVGFCVCWGWGFVYAGSGLLNFNLNFNFLNAESSYTLMQYPVT